MFDDQNFNFTLSVMVIFHCNAPVLCECVPMTLSINPTMENDGHVGPEEKESLAAVIKTTPHPHDQQTSCCSTHESSASAIAGTTAEEEKTRIPHKHFDLSRRIKSDLNLRRETSSPKGKQTEGSLDEMMRKSELKSFDPESPSPQPSLNVRSKNSDGR